MAKKFDCVKMKHDIQEQFYKETEGMELRERMNYIAQKPITNNKVLQFIAKVNQYKTENFLKPFVLAESQAEYATD